MRKILLTFFAAILCAASMTAQVDAPLTFEAMEAGATVTYTLNETAPIQYSTDGTTWTDYSAAITLATIGDKVSFRGSNSAYNQSKSAATFQCDKDCYIYGNIMSLVSATEYATATALSENNTFYRMFYNNTHIKNHPSNDLVLPATTLANECYSYMFRNCSGLTRAPELPATTLAYSCYSAMFFGCTGLTSAPELPATTLATSCYSSMFSGCSGLTSAPALSATTLADYCYQSMFYSCTALTSAPELPATALTKLCYISMFQGCTALTSAPELPATTLANNCYQDMFRGCTSLTSAPELPATTLALSCYSYMFNGCTGLTSAPELPATTLALSCYSYMFNGCTGLTSAPELPATTLANLCYRSMFQGCTNLSSVTCYATVTATNATTDWLNNVAASGTFYGPKNSVFASEERGPSAIPVGWTFSPFQASLTNAPTAMTGLEYTGAAQALLNTDGVAEGGTLNYKLGDGEWSEAIPTATNAGDYTVYYKVVGDASHADYIPSPNEIAVSIAKADAAVTNVPTAIEGLVYTGAAQTLINAGTAEGGELQYKVDDGAYSTDLPQATAIGNHTVYYKVVGDANHSDVAEASFVVTIKMTVYVKKIGTSVHDSYTVEPTTTVFELKQLIATAKSLEAEMINLIFTGHALENGRPLSDYAISHESLIQMAAGRSMTANEDPNNPGTFYTTFYDSALRFVLPDGVEAYVATLSGDALILTKIAESGEILPENTAVILKAEDANVKMGWTEDTPVSFTATNNLHGVDAETEIATVVTSGTCYVLSGGSNGVGFYTYSAPNKLKAHKAYVVIGSGSAAPRRLRFVFEGENTTTGVESIQPSAISSQKVLRNGQLIIIRNGAEYNANGQIVK